MTKVKLGALCWNQYTTWDALRGAGIRADQLGYDGLWTWDHLYPIVGDHRGPMLEGFGIMSAWAEVTERATIGLMVGANPFRNPALVVKQTTTLDHLSHGRAVLGIGAAWFETEHDGLGIEFGASPGERLRWLAEALPIMRGMLDGTEPSSDGRYPVRGALNLPAPVQAHLPLLIGGGGERVTLRLVAQYADANNLGGGFESVAHKEQVLLRHCEDIGRDPSEIERTVGVGTCIIRDDPAEAQRVADAMFAAHGGASTWKNQLFGNPEQVADKLRPFLGIGYRHFLVGFPAPFDAESMERLVTEVRPELERG